MYKSYLKEIAELRAIASELSVRHQIQLYCVALSMTCRGRHVIRAALLTVVILLVMGFHWLLGEPRETIEILASGYVMFLVYKHFYSYAIYLAKTTH